MMGEKVETPFIINLECSEKVMTERILERGKSSGRTDDNLESILKRFRVYNEETSQVINYFKGFNKLVQVNSEGQVEDIFAQLSLAFDKLA